MADFDFSEALQGAFSNPLFGLGIGLMTSDSLGEGLVRGAGLHRSFSSQALKRENNRLELERRRRILDDHRRQKAARAQLFQMLFQEQRQPSMGAGEFSTQLFRDNPVIGRLF